MNGGDRRSRRRRAAPWSAAANIRGDPHMSLLDAESPHPPPSGSLAAPRSGNRDAPPTAPGRKSRRPLRQTFAAALFPLGLAAVAFAVWHWLAVWGEQGLDFSVYWYGGKILNDAGPAASNLYEGNVDWAGGPGLPFTYPPFAALLFSLLARMPEKSALDLFNAAGVLTAAWVAVRALRYWTAKADWRAAFRSPRNRWAAVVLLLAVLNLGPWRETLAF